jgi:hypothetical protein
MRGRDSGRRTLPGLAGLGLWLALGAAPALAFTDEQIADSFRRTVFDAEYTQWGWQSRVVKKFARPVRFFIDNRSRIERRREARAFVASLPGSIRGLKATIGDDFGRANYRIFIVDRAQYRDVVRGDLGIRGRAPGRCVVRVVSGPGGIARADAVIVADEGDLLFRRCLIEEVLQGLGPLNDDARLKESVFNDRSQHADFTLHDRVLLNVLYDPRVKAGMSEREVEAVLPRVIRDARRRVR